MAAIQHAYNAALRADLGYVGLVTKNPLHDHWHVLRLHDDVYSLGELADFVDLTDVRWTRKRAQNEDHYGSEADTVPCFIVCGTGLMIMLMITGCPVARLRCGTRPF